MKDRKLASRYARALLSAVRDPAARERVDEFLTALSSAIGQSPELRMAMLDPAIPRTTRKAILRTLVEPRGLPAELASFLATLVDNNRMAPLATIAQVYHEMREQGLGIVPAELTTAAPLGDELRERARTTLEKLTGRRVRLTCHVEPTLLGGAVTRIGSTVYDGSLRSQLGRLRHRMVSE
jgi:F-type H+-transporting ATPase subunit delta